ncbi:MAG: GNAT family N-acetyltransferase [Kosmotoga sp.]|nr:MAG: GNAT family N-acetyltransferase [Kosmotoga sp.]
MEIVKVDEGDFDRLAKLLNWRKTGTYDEDFNWSAFLSNELSDMIASNIIWIYAARVNNRFVGYVSAAKIPKPDNRKCTIYIDELWVAKKHRNKGIAKKLLEKVIEEAKRIKAWKVRLVVNYDNAFARSLYHSLGFNEKPAVFCEKSF